MTNSPTAVCPQPDADHADALLFPDIDPRNPEMAAIYFPKAIDVPEPEGDSKETSASNGVSRVDSIPPNLEEFIPGERLPDVIDVYLNDNFFISSRTRMVWQQFAKEHPGRAVKFEREYPPRTLSNNDSDCDSDSDRDCQKPLTGELDLRRSRDLGTGNHSKVILAPLMIPSTPPVYGAVAVKCGVVAVKCGHDHCRESADMLLNEALLYNKFPRHLHCDDTPVVPKFYGFYKPSLKWDDNHNDNDRHDSDKKDLTSEVYDDMSAILLLEPCGESVANYSRYYTNKTAIGTLLERLHEAKFVQGSMHHQNVLIQPGPLSVPRANRSLDTPSYRIIDFGRGCDFNGDETGWDTFDKHNLYQEAKADRRSARCRSLID